MVVPPEVPPPKSHQNVPVVRVLIFPIKRMMIIFVVWRVMSLNMCLILKLFIGDPEEWGIFFNKNFVYSIAIGPIMKPFRNTILFLGDSGTGKTS
jgi:hypothetical protein